MTQLCVIRRIHSADAAGRIGVGDGARAERRVVSVNYYSTTIYVNQGKQLLC